MNAALREIMSWASSVDVALFRLVNERLANPVLDWLMPFCNGNRLFVPAILLLCILLLWRGGLRGRVFVPVLLLILALGDMLVINTIKNAMARPRPFATLSDVRLLAGEGYSGSMPSSHTSTWFAATLIACVFYRRSWRVMLPLACIIGFSRIYVGAHYPSDVLAGALIGCGYAAAALLAIEAVWNRCGRTWFPEAWRKWPSLFARPIQPEMKAATSIPASAVLPEERWIKLGYALIAITLVARLIYLASGKIELSEDEAYQWIWSKHLALSYFSKPPFIAYAQFLGTTIWGDNEFGVRFLSPCIGAIISMVMLRFVAREANARAAFWVVVLFHCAPLLAVGAILMTIDPLLVLFGSCAVVAGWRAVQADSRTRDWVWVGAAIGGAFLSKYSALYEIVCFLLFLLLWPSARTHLRRPGPYVALLIVAIASTPVLIWNYQHAWITVRHVSDNAGLARTWEPTLRYLRDFLLAELLLLNPIMLIASVWAWFSLWKRKPINPLLVYFFSMGAPIFIGHLLFTLYYRVQPNWIAPGVVPTFCLMVIYWEQRWREGTHAATLDAGARRPYLNRSLTAAILIGAVPIILLHDTNLITKFTGYSLPVEKDPLHRVRAWREAAEVVAKARQQLLKEGKEVFVIAGHYGLVGELTFYWPEAKARVKDRPLVFYQTEDHPQNQFYFWPGYTHRTGQSAIYVREEDAPMTDIVSREFESVEDLGAQNVLRRGQTYRTLHLYACRNLREHAFSDDHGNTSR